MRLSGRDQAPEQDSRAESGASPSVRLPGKLAFRAEADRQYLMSDKSRLSDISDPRQPRRFHRLWVTKSAVLGYAGGMIRAADPSLDLANPEASRDVHTGSVTAN